MSAIWGQIKYNGVLQEDIDVFMSSVYKERCKIDRYEHCSRDNAYFGCGIQYITDEACAEVLPLYDAERNLLFTADCLLDNRDELIKLLNEKPDISDGALIYKAYCAYGTDCLKHLRGLFAFAVYDLNAKQLFLASDQTASRCLYYKRTEDSIVFSTLIDPIRSLYPQEPDNELWIKDYLTVPGLMPNLSSTETPYKDIFKLNPGTYLIITCDNISEHIYWTPAISEPVAQFDKADRVSEQFFELYYDCVKAALRCNGNISVAMSSGLDSSTVGVLAAKELAKSNRILNTYTYVPCCDKVILKARNNVISEQEDVETIAAMYPNMKAHFVNNEGRNCLESLEDSLRLMEFPFKAYTNLPNLREIYALSAQNGSKVVLTGQCGNSSVSHGYIDDVLYDLYDNHHYIRFLSWLNNYSTTVKESRKKALQGCLGYFKYAKTAYKEAFSSDNFDYTPTNSFVSKDLLTNYPIKERFYANGLRLLKKVPSNRTQYQNWMYNKAMLTYMGELETKMGLAYGIVLRDPTKDMRMLSFCYHLPYQYFAYKGIPRWLIRSSFRELLPSKLIDNWLRYGVQNADFVARIERDMETALPMLAQPISDIKAYPVHLFDTEKLKTYLTNLQDTKAVSDFPELDNLVYCYTVALFLVNAASQC